MGRTSRTMTISVPPEMAQQIEMMMREEGRTRSELIREALRFYIRERSWRELSAYGKARAIRAEVNQSDVEGLVDDTRRARSR